MSQLLLVILPETDVEPQPNTDHCELTMQDSVPIAQLHGKARLPLTNPHVGLLAVVGKMVVVGVVTVIAG